MIDEFDSDRDGHIHEVNACFPEINLLSGLLRASTRSSYFLASSKSLNANDTKLRVLTYLRMTLNYVYSRTLQADFIAIMKQTELY